MPTVCQLMIKIICPNFFNKNVLEFYFYTWLLLVLYGFRKNNRTIPFKFSTHDYRINENKQMTTKIIQMGLFSFACILEGYLTGIGVNRHLNKLSEEEIERLQEPQMIEKNGYTGSLSPSNSW